MKRLLFMAPLLLVLVLACSFGPAAPTTTPSSTGAPPSIIAFTATPSAITPAQQSTLSWNVTGATSVQIDNGIGSVAAAGTRIVSPNTSVTYILIATNAYGTVSSSVGIAVGGVLPPLPKLPPNLPGPSGPLPGAKPNIVIFDISPNIIRKHLNEKATMRWDVAGANNVRIEPGFGDVPNSGNRVLTPPNDTLYTLTAHNANGTVSATQRLVVNP